jgi:hypothetical protein
MATAEACGSSKLSEHMTSGGKRKSTTNPIEENYPKKSLAVKCMITSYYFHFDFISVIIIIIFSQIRRRTTYHCIKQKKKGNKCPSKKDIIHTLTHIITHTLGHTQHTRTHTTQDKKPHDLRVDTTRPQPIHLMTILHD